MEPKKQITANASDDSIAVEHMKAIVSEYEMPEHYQSLVNGPWRLVAHSLLQSYGEDSDAWSRMTWFSRILCTAIESSLERNTPEAVNDALNGFSIWLNSMRDDSEAYSMCVSAANYAQRRISSQIAEDTTAPETADTRAVPDVEEISIDGLPELDTLAEPAAPPSLELLDTVQQIDAPSAEAEIEAETETETKTETTAEPLSLSLAYSANSNLDEQVPEPEQPALPEQTERDTTMETQVNAAPEQASTSHYSGQPAPEVATHSARPAGAVAPVPMGTWLAFHDQDTPTVARLAMYDAAEETFMLGNKSGILVRKISKAQLNALIEREEVQLVEFRNITQ